MNVRCPFHQAHEYIQSNNFILKCNIELKADFIPHELSEFQNNGPLWFKMHGNV